MDTCPPLEEIAAFLDDTLSPQDRERITAHLASCESCYEVFAGAVHFQEEEASAGDTTGGVIPFPFAGETDRAGVSLPQGEGSEKVRPRASRWLALAASILIVPALGFLAWRTFQADPKIVLADVAQPFKKDAGIPSLLFDTENYRSGGNLEDLLGRRSSFMAGVHLLDLHLSLQAEESARTADILQDLAIRLDAISTMEPLSKQYFEDYTKAEEDPEELRLLAPEILGREAETQEALSILAPVDFSFGLWAEAGRLAAVTYSPEFFKDRNNRRFLSHLFEVTPWEGDDLLEDVPGELQTIQQIWEGGDLDSKDYSALAGHFKHIIDAYNTPDEP